MRPWLTLLCAGLAGLALGWLPFPTSNLLGGAVLVFAPIVWVGALVTLFAGRVTWLLDRRKDRRAHTSEERIADAGSASSPRPSKP
jgi:hypothetical protein